MNSFLPMRKQADIHHTTAEWLSQNSKSGILYFKDWVFMSSTKKASGNITVKRIQPLECLQFKKNRKISEQLNAA